MLWPRYFSVVVVSFWKWWCFACQEVDSNSKLACIHDSARPLVLTEDVEKVWYLPLILWLLQELSGVVGSTSAEYNMNSADIIVFIFNSSSHNMPIVDILYRPYVCLRFWRTNLPLLFSKNLLCRSWRMVGWLEQQYLGFRPKQQSKRYLVVIVSILTLSDSY